MNNKIFIFAGEASGDLHGSRLMKELKSGTTPIEFSGVGGPEMEANGFKSLLPFKDLQVMGFSAVIKSLPTLWRHFYKVKNEIITTQPEAVVLIDYPGFNLRLAKALRKEGYQGKIVQVIAPTVWAHGKNRIDTMASTLDLLLTIYPFESNFFAHTPLKTVYIGNPIQEYLMTYAYDDDWKKGCGLCREDSIIALFPGSRLKEIQANLPLQLQTASLLKKNYPEVKFGLSYTQESHLSTIHSLITQSGLRDIHLIPRKWTYELMRDANAALAKSGTVTLELAMHLCPTVMMYQLSFFDFLMAKFVLQLKLPHYCIVNIIANREIYPEFIGRDIDMTQLYQSFERTYSDTNRRETMKQECLEVRSILGNSNACQNGAKAIQELIRC